MNFTFNQYFRGIVYRKKALLIPPYPPRINKWQKTYPQNLICVRYIVNMHALVCKGTGHFYLMGSITKHTCMEY